MPIVVTNLKFSYADAGGSSVRALRGVNLRVEEGEIVAVLGRTGAGKSTLMLHLNGLLTGPKGAVQVDGFDPARSGADLAEVRRRVGLVFQQPEGQLFAETVADDVAFGPRNAGCSAAETERRVVRALADVGLDPEGVAGRSPFALSGGEQRRVAIAGVLALDPKFLVLDEPTAGLDGSGRRGLWSLLHRLRRRDNTGVVFVTHEVEDAARHADRVVVLADGEIALQGAPTEVFQARHGRRLKEVGLHLPAAAAVAAALARRGWVLPEGPMTEQAVAEAVAKMKAKAVVRHVGCVDT